MNNYLKSLVMPLSKSSPSYRLLREIYRLARHKKIRLFIVGGVLRDMLLLRQKENPDIDFCLQNGAINFGRLLARKMRAGFVVLDKERGYCRLVKSIKDKAYTKVCTLDFTDFRGARLEDDLGLRDFSINAMALELEKFISGSKLEDLIIDPYEGKKDLKSKLIRVVHKNNFVDDPLRILRAFSLAAIFGFKIEKNTLRLMQRDRQKLALVSAERVRDELFKILDTPLAFEYIAALDKLKILGIILPEAECMRAVKQGPYHHLDVLKHSLETVRQLEMLFSQSKNNPEIQSYLNECISSGRKRRALMKLGAFLHDIGKPKAKRRKAGKTVFYGHERVGTEISEEIIKRLKLSNDEWQALRKMILWHLRPGYLGDSATVTARAKFRYFRDTGKEGVSTLMLSIADQRSTCGPLTSKQDHLQHEKICLKLIKDYFKQVKEVRLKRLINGDELMQKFKLSPSPLVGEILSELEELQVIGKIKTKPQALIAAKRMLKKTCTTKP